MDRSCQCMPPIPSEWSPDGVTGVLSREALIAELEALRAVEQEYRTLLDESSDPIFAFRPDGSYRYVNHARCRRWQGAGRHHRQADLGRLLAGRS